MVTRHMAKSRSVAPLVYRHSALNWIAVAAVAFTVNAAKAATPLMIWPVDPVITSEHPAVALWVENRGLRPVSLQVRVLEWNQSDGDESFAPQKAVVASPPISLIPPGKRQMVRLVAMVEPPINREGAYRVLIDELPAPADLAPADPVATETAMGIRLSVRYAIPLFLYGGGAQPYRPKKQDAHRGDGKPLPPAVTWQTVKHGKSHRIVMRNRGTGHARITAVRWEAAAEASATRARTTINEGLMGYVLPHSQMHWELEQPPPPNPVLRATINGEEALIPRDGE